MIELTSEMAERGAAAARSHARQLGTPMTVAVADESGRLVLAVRGDGYTTYEPCPMCAWAICLAGLSAVVIGARFARVGDTRHGGYAIERLLGLAAQPLTVVSGVLEEECVRLRRPAEASR